MGIFSRLGDIIESNINELLDRAENPEKMVGQIVIDMQREFNKAVQNYGRVKANENLAEKKYQDALKVSQSWETKAKTALSQGNRELAKMVLVRKVKADEDVSAYREMYESMSVQAESVRKQVDELKIKLDEAKNRQAILMARSRMADTKKNIAKATGGFDGSSAIEKFNRMEEKIVRKEAEADAFSEIGNADVLKNSFEQLETDAKAEAELARLMAEMNVSED
ncbi:MAG: PspA/IM30 family protein [Ruminococcus sp.]|nr:PspA/IM30 family protein [Ruminococcus sp.]MDE6848655.1 PspA/IM30 family protein [Ruminococcus sp.]